MYDACVLYLAPLRDFLIWLGLSGLFRARWSEQIHDEWKRNLLKNRPDLTVGMLKERAGTRPEILPAVNSSTILIVILKTMLLLAGLATWANCLSRTRPMPDRHGPLPRIR